MSPLYTVRVLLALTASLLTTNVLVNGSGDGMPIADLCNGSMTFSNASSFLPGQDVTITCSLPNTILSWVSPQFTTVTLINMVETSDTRLDEAIIFNLTNVITGSSECATATATIANIQESMQGLSLTCTDGSDEATVIIDVIDPPPAVNFMAVQSFSETVISWTSLPDEPCPISNYTIIIDGSTINSSPVTVSRSDNQYACPITDECGSSLEISMFATSAAGPGSTMTKNLTVFGAPVDLSLCAVMEFNETSVQGSLLIATWKLPLEELPEVDLIIEVNSTTMSPTLDASTTMYQIEDVTFPGMYNVTSYFEGQRNSSCFSTSNQSTIPNAFPMVTISESTVESDEAFFILMIDSSVFTVIDDNLELFGGDGECRNPTPPSQPPNVTCDKLKAETFYNLTVDMSVGGSCLMLLISFDTPPMTSSSTGSSTVPFLGTSSIVSPLPATTKTVSSTSIGTMMSSFTTEPTTPEDSSSLVVIISVSVGVPAAVFVIISLIMIFLIYRIQKQKRKVSLGHEQEGDGDGGPIPLVLRKEKDPKTGEVGTYDGPDGQEKKVHHQEAPTGDEYAVVEKPAMTRRAAPSTPQFEAMTYQDPNTIQREEAPTGDLYALPQSKGKETKEPMPVYSEVNKQPDRVYADLALPKGGDSGVNRQPPTQEVFYSQVQKL